MLGQLLPFEVFWIYVLIFVISAMGTVEIGYLLSNKAPSKVKRSTFECGQVEDVHPHEIFIIGADRYFAYAVAFFILDAFTWILIAGANAVDFFLAAGLFIATYLIVLMAALSYYIIKVREGLG
jgi:NADH:ubiquinone oxidoreductase subunit 3 (subunit A)